MGSRKKSLFWGLLPAFLQVIVWLDASLKDWEGDENGVEIF